LKGAVPTVEDTMSSVRNGIWMNSIPACATIQVTTSSARTITSRESRISIAGTPARNSHRAIPPKDRHRPSTVAR
jgi:hypothetical protein